MAFRIGTLLLALVLLSSPAAAHAQAGTPAETLVGQQVSPCPAGVPLAVTVTSGLWWPTIAGVAAPDGDRWLIVFADVRNDGTAAGRVAGTLSVRDEQGREVSAEDAGGPQSTFLADFYDMDDASSLVLPSTRVSTFVLFAVAAEAQTLTLVATPGACA